MYGDGSGISLPFFFLRDTIVVCDGKTITELGLSEANIPRGATLELEAVPLAMARMPDLQGWAWSEPLSSKHLEWRGRTYVSHNRPSETIPSKSLALVGDGCPREGTWPSHDVTSQAFWRLEFASDGNCLFAVGDEAQVLWEFSPSGASALWVGWGYHRGVHSACEIERNVAFSPDGSLLVQVGSSLSFGEQWVRLYGPTSGRLLRQWSRSQRCRIGSVRFSPDSKYVFLWRGFPHESPQPFVRIEADSLNSKDCATTASIVDGVFTPTGRASVLVARNRDGSIGLWDWKRVKQRATVDFGTGSIEDIAVSPDGKVVAVATEKRVHFLDIATRKPVGGDTYEHPKVKRIRFANDNKHFASLGADGELRVWTLDFMEQIDPLKVAPQYDGQSF
jgi:WD40 repeat protein